MDYKGKGGIVVRDSGRVLVLDEGIPRSPISSREDNGDLGIYGLVFRTDGSQCAM